MPLSKLVRLGHVSDIGALPYYAGVLRSTLRLLGRRNVTTLNRTALDEKRKVEIVWWDARGQRLTGLTHFEGEEESSVDTVTGQGIVPDELIQDTSKRVRFIMLDIEGAELPALKGATQLIVAHQPIIFSELNEEWWPRFRCFVADVFSSLVERPIRGLSAGQMASLPG